MARNSTGGSTSIKLYIKPFQKLIINIAYEQCVHHHHTMNGFRFQFQFQFSSKFYFNTSSIVLYSYLLNERLDKYN